MEKAISIRCISLLLTLWFFAGQLYMTRKLVQDRFEWDRVSGSKLQKQHLEDFLSKHKSDGSHLTAQPCLESKALFPSSNNITTTTAAAAAATATASLHRPGVAVCLSFSDDNAILPEWLAYHYTTLPLRYLVVLVDPLSQTSPKDILSKWNTSDLITTWIWKDEDVLDKFMLARLQKLGLSQSAEDVHTRLKKRQRDFVRVCNQFFKRLSLNENDGNIDNNSINISWVGHFDVDEFAVPNQVAEWEKKKIQKKRKAQMTEQLLDIKNLGDSIKLRERTMKQIFKHDSSNTPVHTIDVINEVRHLYKTPNCIPMARWNHGSHPRKDSLRKPVHSEGQKINTSLLETIQYVRGDHPVRPNVKMSGKMMVDVSAISMEDLSGSVSAHRPLRWPFCNKATINYLEAFVVLNHYRGSWERYSFRNDTRRTYKQWNKENDHYKKMDSTHYEIHQWLPRFIQLVGSGSIAATLLGHSSSSSI